MANEGSNTEAQKSQLPARRSFEGTRSKLRDSCHACAVSKVKCPKEKPTCSRCESRGTPCQYFLTKRPGRRRESETNDVRGEQSRSGESVNGSSHRHETDTIGGRSGYKHRNGDTIQAASPFTSERLFSRTATPPSTKSPKRNSCPGTPNPPTTPSMDHILSANPSDLFSALATDDLFPEFADFNSEVNDMDFVMSGIQSPFDFPMLDTGGSENSAITGPQPDIGSLLMAPESNSNDLSASSSETSSAGDTLNPSSSGGLSTLDSGDQPLTASLDNAACATQPPQCGCLMQGLDLLKFLSSTRSTPHTASSGGTPEPSIGVNAGLLSGSSSSNDGPARAILAKNKQSIETINQMLACGPCTGDSFLLAVSSMVVLKVLERYAAVARGQQPQRDDRPQPLERRSAQTVLRELHRVQRVVNQLSPKLKAPGDGGGGLGLGVDLDFWGQTGSQMRMAGTRRNSTPTSFSMDTLDRLEKDVRKSLSSLSSGIIEVLRQA